MKTSLFSASRQTFVPAKWLSDTTLHCLTAACQFLPTGSRPTLSLLPCLSGRKLLLHGLSAGGVFGAARDPPRHQLPAGPHHAHHHLPTALQRLPPHRPRGQSLALGVMTQKRIFNKELLLLLLFPFFLFCLHSPAEAVSVGNVRVLNYSRLFAVFRPTDWSRSSSSTTAISHPFRSTGNRSFPFILKFWCQAFHLHLTLFCPSLRCSATNPTPYDEIRPTLLNPVKEPTSDTESIPSPSTSPVLQRRHYGESITSLGKASILGEAQSAASYMIYCPLSTGVPDCRFISYWTLLLLFSISGLIIISWETRDWVCWRCERNSFGCCIVSGVPPCGQIGKRRSHFALPNVQA